MEKSKYLIDTNVVIEYLGKKFSAKGMDFLKEIINAVPNLSIITKIELLGFNTIKDHQILLSGFISDSNVFSLSDKIVDETISIRKLNKVKIPDAIIAATSIVQGLVLITRNTADFKNIKELQLFDVHSL